MSDHHHDLPPVDPRIEAAAAEGCPESRLLISRRAALGLSASFFTWAYMPRLGEASPIENARSSDPRLLLVILRGGMDGINVVVPTGDPNYACQRGGLALNAASGLRDLNGFFSLHPSLAFFHQLFQQKDALAIHAIAPPLQNRSHFECQRNLENGEPGGRQGPRGGWLNRLLVNLPAGHPVLVNGGALHVGPTPLILSGDSESGFAKVLSWSPSRWRQPADFNAAVEKVYGNKSNRGGGDARDVYTDRGLFDLYTGGLALDAIATATSTGGVTLSSNPSNLQTAFRGAAQLMSGEKGAARIAVLNVEGWDTHIGQASALSKNLSDLDKSLKDFYSITNARGVWNDTVVAIVTEFGRTAKANGAAGTEHGVGTVALLAGGKVNGGRVVMKDNSWPGLHDNYLFQRRDLWATYDLRQLFKSLLVQHLDIRDQNLVNNIIFRGSAALTAIPDLICSAAPLPAVPPRIAPPVVNSSNAAIKAAKMAANVKICET